MQDWTSWLPTTKWNNQFWSGNIHVDVRSSAKSTWKLLHGTLTETTEIWTHTCSCHNLPPFFCADTFDTSLLFIVCALRWFVKSLYRHLFLEDHAKRQGALKKLHYLICGKLNSNAPWKSDPKIGVWVAKVLSCDMVV